MAALFGAIADDFTGATDLAGLLARSGLPVCLRLGVPSHPVAAEQASPFEIIALKCRTLPAAEAVAEARAALAWLRSVGARRFYWKYCSTFDSTREGNIGPVAEALMADLGIGQTLYCPAFPENGRSIFMGHLFVGEQLLSESPMKDHPLTPMRDSSLVRLLGPQVKGAVGLANRHVVAQGPQALKARLDELYHRQLAHIIVDAVEEEDLVTIATAAVDMLLITGGSALAAPLPRLYLERGLMDRASNFFERPSVEGGQIVLSGSCSAMTRQQVAHYLEEAESLRLDPLSLQADGVEPALQWLRARQPAAAKIIYATAEPEEVRAAQQQLGAARAGHLVEDALARLAQEAFRMGIRRFVVAGGESSGAVAKALGVTRLAIGCEIAPGVPWTYAEVAGETVALALKSGNFGSADFFHEAFQLLEAA
ncbi:3-oxo-tetronate kinase [Rhizobium sp. CSW-27]|uniref:3-oxo-tetronate kinase n=1 Tax=Rhizobium sp. CSW-27 TaxID=2839985 RepID=UPI001C013BB4|nr:3-oxo-tetronate kinase [Rhizobium sp. CSW-27]MBT9369666.1 four-carbon acid sugar kinase family protein [Rhizobium sp. CSW-27]